MEFKVKMWAGCYKCNQIKPKHVGSIANACESCQNEISVLITSVNGGDLALGQGHAKIIYLLTIARSSEMHLAILTA